MTALRASAGSAPADCADTVKGGAASAAGAVTLGAMDLEAQSGVVYPDLSQGSLNMCTSMALVHGFALVAALARQAPPPPPLAPTYAYYFQRVAECTDRGVCACPAAQGKAAACAPPCLDCGSLFSSALEVFGAGVPPAALWPAVTAPLAAANATPSAAAQAAAPATRLTQWACLPDVGPGTVQRALAAGHPVLVFWNVSANIVRWMAAQAHVGGLVETLAAATAPPFDSTATPIQGHAVLIVGTTPAGFIVRNSFGNAWGARGRCLIALTDFTPAAIRTAVALQGIRSPSTP
jgi:hypothetical protein